MKGPTQREGRTIPPLVTRTLPTLVNPCLTRSTPPRLHDTKANQSTHGGNTVVEFKPPLPWGFEVSLHSVVVYNMQTSQICCARTIRLLTTVFAVKLDLSHPLDDASFLHNTPYRDRGYDQDVCSWNPLDVEEG